jgi:hypothetical protein
MFDYFDPIWPTKHFLQVWHELSGTPVSWCTRVNFVKHTLVDIWCMYGRKCTCRCNEDELQSYIRIFSIILWQRTWATHAVPLCEWNQSTTDCNDCFSSMHVILVPDWVPLQICIFINQWQLQNEKPFIFTLFESLPRPLLQGASF